MYKVGYTQLDEKEIARRLEENEALFRNVCIVSQRYDIIPKEKEHIGAYIEYQDLKELREDFVNELADSIVSWVYSSEKFSDLKKLVMEKGKPESSATMEIGRKAKMKFRADHNSEDLLIQGQLGELLLFHFIQKCFRAVPLLRKMKIATSSQHERFGADAIHYKIENGKNIIILGEAKTYTSNYKFSDAFSDAIESILSTYENHRKELNLYVHEDFLDSEMNDVAEKYLTNTLENVEIQLVVIVTYNENKTLNISDKNDIKKQIEAIIEERYKQYDNKKIDIVNNPILKRITYIVFPVWDLKGLAELFQSII